MKPHQYLSVYGVTIQNCTRLEVFSGVAVILIIHVHIEFDTATPLQRV